MLSVYDLAFNYLERFYSKDPSNAEKRQIIRNFEDLLYYGWTLKDIVSVMQTHLKNFPNIRPNIQELFQKARQTEQNLMSPDEFYYHNQLRIVPGAPQRHLDINTGEITRYSEEYFLEMRASYTINDLTTYFMKQFGLDENEHTRKKLVGGFQYMLKTHDLESLLFMIDIAINTIYSEDMDRYGFSVFKLADYKTLALNQYNDKKTENRVSGDDRIVPRKRILSCRSSDSI